MIARVSGDRKPDSGGDASPCGASEATGAPPTEVASQAHPLEHRTNLSPKKAGDQMRLPKMVD